MSEYIWEGISPRTLIAQVQKKINKSVNVNKLATKSFLREAFVLSLRCFGTVGLLTADSEEKQGWENRAGTD